MMRVALLSVLLVALAGCFHTRWRIGKPLCEEGFLATRIGDTTLPEALDMFGPPFLVVAGSDFPGDGKGTDRTYMYWICVDMRENRLFAPSGAGGAQARAQSFLSSGRERPDDGGVLLEAVWSACTFDRAMLSFDGKGTLSGREFVRQTSR